MKVCLDCQGPLQSQRPENIKQRSSSEVTIKQSSRLRQNIHTQLTVRQSSDNLTSLTLPLPNSNHQNTFLSSSSQTLSQSSRLSNSQSPTLIIITDTPPHSASQPTIQTLTPPTNLNSPVNLFHPPHFVKPTTNNKDASPSLRHPRQGRRS